MPNFLRFGFVVLVSFGALTGCTDNASVQADSASNVAAGAKSAPATKTSSGSTASATDTASVTATAAVGKPAPDFTLKDLDGKEVSLASFKGKTIVLEWFNPGCPFVKAAHTKGSLKGYVESLAAKDVVWLSINSGAPGKQGAGAEANKEGAAALGIKNPILLDESGAVGKTYGATNTPHMYVIDPTGTLVYAGAIDNSPDGEGESPTGDKLVNHVAEALDAIEAKRAVTVPQTKAYGCSVKYGS